MTSIYKKFVECDEDRAIFVGGRQSGKTTTLLEKAARCAKNGLDIVIVAKSEEMRRILEDRFVLSKHGYDVSFITERELRGSPMVDAVFVDEVLHFGDDSLRSIELLSQRIYATTTPWTISGLFRYDSFKKFFVPTRANNSVNEEFFNSWKQNVSQIEHMSADSKYGHSIITSGREEKEEVLCIDCGMTEVQETDNAVEILYIYAKFLEADCERFK